MVASNAGKNKASNPRNPERCLVRYQMIEMIVRIGLRKFMKNGICQIPAEAVDKFLKDNIVKSFKSMDSHKWRVEKYWNEECDTVLKKYLPILKELYKKYSGRHALPGRPKYMSMDEFIQMVNDGGLVDEKFGSREIGILYNLAMFTHVDEIDDDGHMKMGLDEFMDALGRVADRVSLPSPYDPPQDRTELENNPTHIKLKNTIEILLKNTLRRDFIDFAEKKLVASSRPSPRYNQEASLRAPRLSMAISNVAIQSPFATPFS